MGAGVFVAGAGASDMNQGAEEFFLGMSGDSTTPTRNGMSDLFYGGNDTIYHLSTGTAAMAGSMLTPYVNAQAAKMAAVKSTAGKSAVTKPTVAEAAGGTADDALEQFYDDIFESSYGEQFDPVKEQAIAGPGEIAISRAEATIAFPQGEAQLKHIFRAEIGHLLDTAANRQKILDVANNLDNYIGQDARGNDWYAIISEDGTQTWVRVRNGIIDNAGVNDVPRIWDSETGLYNNTKKK